MIQITEETLPLFIACLEKGLKESLPMLPFVKREFHNFDIYKTLNKSAIYLLDTVGEHHCLYHLYKLDPNDSMLRTTLILPTSWEHRFEIIETSIPRLKAWLDAYPNASKLMVQSLEYGEVEYYPTLSHYLIPTLINQNFEPTYRMYMKRYLQQTEPILLKLEERKNALLEQHDFTLRTVTENDTEALLDLYDREELKSRRDFVFNCTNEELTNFLKDPFTLSHSYVMLQASHAENQSMAVQERKLDHTQPTAGQRGKIVGAVIISRDNEKIWIDNLVAIGDANSEQFIAQILVAAALSNLPQEETLYTYLNRDTRLTADTYSDFGFEGFEFWTDLIYESSKTN